ncbi:MAG: SgcJ/EcaC family oxidoreductase [Betaproteobacteria bacterium]
MNEPDAPILQMLAAYKAAVHAKDVDAFCALFADDLRVFDLWGRWSHDGLPAWRDMATGWFGSLGDERVVVEFDEVRTRVSGDMATAHAFTKFGAISPAGDTLRSLSNRLTWVLQRQGDAWKVIHEHTSAPVDGATGKVIFER